MSQYFEVHPLNPQPRLLKQAVQILQAGGVPAIPTDSSYALACHLDDKAAAEQVEQGAGDRMLRDAQADRPPRRMRDPARHFLGRFEDEGERSRRRQLEEAVLAVVDACIARQLGEIATQQCQVVALVDGANAAQLLGGRLVVEMAGERVALSLIHI